MEKKTRTRWTWFSNLLISIIRNNNHHWSASVCVCVCVKWLWLHKVSTTYRQHSIDWSMEKSFSHIIRLIKIYFFCNDEIQMTSVCRYVNHVTKKIIIKKLQFSSVQFNFDENYFGYSNWLLFTILLLLLTN